MTARPISPFVKTALEFGPVLGFFLAYLWLKDDSFELGGRSYTGFIVVTAGFVPVLLACIAALWKLTGKISRMQVMTAVLVVVFGGLTVVFNNEAFFKIKTTLVYGLFAAILGIGLLRGRSLLAWVMEDLLPLTETGFEILTRRLTAMFASLAIANEIVWRTLSTEAWVKIETFGFPVALFAFFMLQGRLFEAHGTEEAKDEA